MTAAPPNLATSPLAKPVNALWGVGPERAAQLARLKISTIEDLLLHRPRRYEDRRHFQPIADLRLDEPATTRGTVVALGVKRFRHGQKSVFELILDDGTARLHCRWWNLPFMEKYFSVGDDVIVFGKALSLKPRTLDHPETEVVQSGEEHFIHFNRITPVYPLTEGLPQRWLRSLIWRTLQQFEQKIAEPRPKLRLAERVSFGVSSSAGTKQSELGSTRALACSDRRPRWSVEGVKESPDSDPSERLRVVGEGADRPAAAGRGRVRSPFSCETPSGGPPAAPPAEAGTPNLPSRANAIRMLHFPETMDDIEIARRRLALDEFLELQFQIQLRRRKFEANAQALPCGGDNRLIRPFLAALGFKLTGAQAAVLREIRADLRGRHPMRRLLQGDVGSGKTVVSACSALMAIESGYNAALMAPTEILAEQHFLNFKKWFEPLGVGVVLRTGGKKISNIEHPTSNVQQTSGAHPASRIQHPASVFVGTHALLENTVAIGRLGLVIIDEQQKFGVAQREQILRKGRYPHLLVMTATPIPRTLGLTIYGELDISVIHEPPPGRGRVMTFVRTADTLPKVWEFIREKLARGRQAYVVYPRVEETGQNGIKAVTREFANLERALAPFRVGLLHGRLNTAEKEAVMTAFRANTVQVLLATSLIEIGVDVPNASLMLVENAEQFGLAQLHQLRGRIGRGAQDSYCILVATATSPEARNRLKVLSETADGFRIAEADLELRGPGELLGQQQSGVPNLRFGDLAADWEWIDLARRLASREM